MSIIVECGACGKKYRFQDHQAGALLPCKKCGFEMLVPGGAGSATLRRTPSAGTGASGGTNWIPWAAGGGGVLALVLILLFVFSGGGDDPAHDSDAVAQSNSSNSAPSIPDAPSRPRASDNFGRGRPRPSNSGAGTPPSGGGGFQANAPSRVKPSPGDVRPRTDPNADDVRKRIEELRNQFNQNAGTRNGANPARRPTGWKVTPDPPPAEYVIDPDADSPLVLRFPPRQNAVGVLYAGSYGPFVAIGGNSSPDQKSFVYDLRNGEKVGTISNISTDRWTKVALSPDGKYLALTIGGLRATSIGIWSTEADQPLWELKTDDVKSIAFVGPDRLLEVRRDAFVLWDVKTGQEEFTIDQFQTRLSDVACVSPGGRYVAMIGGAFTPKVEVIDLENGVSEGTLDVPKPDSLGSRPRGLAFSPDGAELAAYLGDGRESARFFVWSVATGQLVDDISIANSYDKLAQLVRTYAGPNLQWFPGGQRWLIDGHGILDRGAKNLVAILPTDKFAASRRPLTPTKILSPVVGRTSATLKSISLPVEALQKATELVKQGGQVGDVLEHEIVKGDTHLMKTVTASANEWNVSPDPAPDPVDGLLSRSREIGLDRNEGDFSQILLSDASAGRLLVAHTAETGRSAFRREQAEFKLWIDVYPLALGVKRTPTIEIDAPSEAISFSPSGKFVLVRESEDQERLDVWDVDQKEQQFGFRPFDEKPNTSSRTRSDYGGWVWQNRQVASARFIDDEHLITLSGEKTLRVWKIPECRAIYQMTEIGLPGMTPGGNYLIMHRNDRLTFYDVRTGQPRGALNAEGTMTAAGFLSNGTRMAMVLGRGADTFLSCWDIASGQQITEFPLPGKAHSLRFCDERNVLLNGKMLVNLERAAVAWNFEFPPQSQIPHPIDDRILYYSPDPDDRTPTVIVTAVSLPSDEVRRKIDESSLNGEYISLNGKKIRVTASLIKVPDNKNFQAQTVEHMKSLLGGIGAVPSDLGALELRASMKEGKGGSVTYNIRERSDPFSGMFIGPSIFDRGGASRQESASYRTIVCAVDILDSGTSVWTDSQVVSNRSWSVSFRKDVGLQATLDKRLWGGVQGFFEQAQLPTFVFPIGARDGLGQTYLTAKGLP